MAHLGEEGRWRGANPLGGRVGRRELRVRRLEIGELAQHPVVDLVLDRRVVEDVVAVVRVVERGAQLGGARGGISRHRPRRGRRILVGGVLAVEPGADVEGVLPVVIGPVEGDDLLERVAIRVAIARATRDPPPSGAPRRPRRRPARGWRRSRSPSRAPRGSRPRCARRPRARPGRTRSAPPARPDAATRRRARTSSRHAPAGRAPTSRRRGPGVVRSAGSMSATRRQELVARGLPARRGAPGRADQVGHWRILVARRVVRCAPARRRRRSAP